MKHSLTASHTHSVAAAKSWHKAQSHVYEKKQMALLREMNGCQNEMGDPHADFLVECRPTVSYYKCCVENGKTKRKAC